MDIVLRTGFEKITHSKNFYPQTLIKAKKLFESFLVREIEEIRYHNADIISIAAKLVRQTNVGEEFYCVLLIVSKIRI